MQKTTRKPVNSFFKKIFVEAGTQVANYAIIFLISILIGALVIFLSGKDPIAAYKALWIGAFGNGLKFADTLDRSTVMILAGVAGALAFRTNVTNLGLEGQLYMGAFAAAWVGFSIHGLPSYVHIPLCLIAGCLGGAIWTLPVIYLKLRWNITELVTTLMMNYIGIRFTEYLIAFPFKDPTATLAGSPVLDASARLPKLMQGSTLNIGFIIAIAVAIFVYWFLFKSKTGYEMRMVGLNKDFAAASGIPVNRSYILAMTMSGAIVGLGGAIMITGFFGRFLGSFSSGYGWDGMMIALLAQNHPLGVLPASLFYGALANGALAMQSATGVPQTAVVMVKGSIMFFVTVTVFVPYIRRRLEKWVA
ncbi:MAG TPA: ABC transporter permease [Anaerolineaceae bacterium]|nr:ABC transporter permease [Anaerolineaceae bacterium]